MTSMSISSKQGIRTRFPTADDDEPDGDPQEVCRSGDGYWVRFRGADLELIFVTSEDSGATDDMLWVYTDASESIDIVQSFINVERFDVSLNGRSPLSSKYLLPDIRVFILLGIDTRT